MSEVTGKGKMGRRFSRVVALSGWLVAIAIAVLGWTLEGKISPAYKSVAQEKVALEETNGELEKKVKDLEDKADATNSADDALQKKYDDLKTEYDALKEEYDELTTSKASEVKGKTYLTDVQVTDKDSGIAVGETVKDTYGKEYKRAITFPKSHSVDGISVTLLTAQKYDHLRFWVVPTKDMEKGQSTVIRVYDNTSDDVIKETDEIIQETHGDERYYDLTITGADSITLNASYDGNVAVYGYFYNN